MPKSQTLVIKNPSITRKVESNHVSQKVPAYTCNQMQLNLFWALQKNVGLNLFSLIFVLI